MILPEEIQKMVSHVDLILSQLSIDEIHPLNTATMQEIKWRHEATIADWYKSKNEKEVLQEECFILNIE